MAHKIPKIV